MVNKYYIAYASFVGACGYGVYMSASVCECMYLCVCSCQSVYIYAGFYIQWGEGRGFPPQILQFPLQKNPTVVQITIEKVLFECQNQPQMVYNGLKYHLILT